MKLLFILLAMCAVPSEAFAYIDPGSGMLMWQGLIAAVGAVLIFVRNPIQILKAWFKRFKGK